MQKKYTPEELLEQLKKMAAETSQADVANRLGISKQMMNDVLFGRRLISERLAAALGYEKEVRFRKIA